MNKFYDTSSLIKNANSLFTNNDQIIISSITLEELENIKTSSKKDNDIKFAARQLLHLLDINSEKYTVIFFNTNFLKPFLKQGFEITNDIKILSCAVNCSLNREIVFLTNDLNLKHIAKLFLTNVESIPEEDDSYTGYKHLYLTDEEIAEIYSLQPKNKYNLLTNQYVIIHNIDGEVIDKVCWNGLEYRPIKTKPIQSKWFGKISPFNGDIYQILAIDSLYNNQLTVLRGRPGTGKSCLGLTYLFSLLEKGDLDKIYILCNPVATRDAAKLGFYPGDRDIKLLDSQVGNFLFGKFGDRVAVEKLIDDGKLVLIPTADCRGMDISNHCGVYITEAQNSTIDMMKLMVQRIGEETKVVIEGDDKAQTDLVSYEGKNNGLARLSQVFRGQNYYGEVTLQNCYRSRIADRAELM